MGRPAPGLLQRSWPWTPGRPRRWLLRVSERLLRDRPARWTIGSLPIGRTAAALGYGLWVTRRGPTRRRTAQDAEVPLASRSITNAARQSLLLLFRSDRSGSRSARGGRTAVD